MDFKSGFWQSDGRATNIILGFVPDFLLLYEDVLGAVAPAVYMWNRAIGASGLAGQYGWTDASTGDWAACADGDNGIIAHTGIGIYYVNVESPIIGVGKKATPVIPWGASAAKLARSATAIGSIVRPATRNGYVYECTTAGTTNDTEGEPTFPTTPGETVTETDGVVWTCRVDEAVRGGGQGFTMGTTIQTDGQYVHFFAVRTNMDGYLGDAANGNIDMGVM